MGEASQSPFVGPGEMVTAALVARRYYYGHRSKVDLGYKLSGARSGG